MEDKHKRWKLFPVNGWEVNKNREELENLLNTGEWDIHSVVSVSRGDNQGTTIYNLRRVNMGFVQVKGPDNPET